MRQERSSGGYTVFITSFTMSLRYSCRHCNATSYKRVIQRDAHGQMRDSNLFRCSGCSVVFTDPQAWRQVAQSPHAPQSSEGTPHQVPQRALTEPARKTSAPNFATGWMPITGSAR